MRKIFLKIHLWLSIPFGLIITVICLSGASLVFETEIMELLYPDRYFVEQTRDEAIPIDQLLESIKRELPDTVSVTGVNIFGEKQRAYQFSLSKPRKASISVNQYTGEICAYNQKTAFFSFMFKLHRWLLDGMKQGGSISVGKTIVGISTLLMVIILISGVVVWIPRSYKSLKNRLKISTTKGSKRFWYDLHVSGGIHITVILLSLALTGLTWSFSWYKNGFYKVFGVNTTATTQHNTTPKRTKENYLSWQLALDNLKEQNKDFKKINISNLSATVSFDEWGNQRASDQYKFDGSTGEITQYKPYLIQDKSSKIRGWIYSIHIGSWGGLFSKILVFISSLTGAFLPLTGYYFWIKKVYSKRVVRK